METKTIIILTSIECGYAPEPYIIRVAAEKFDRTLEIITMLQEDKSKVTLKDIRTALALNYIEFWQDQPDAVINL